MNVSTRIVSWRAGLAAALLLTAIVTPPANADDAALVTTAIYLQHVGPSDKPIFPVVICEARPSEAELAQVLGTGPSRSLISIVKITKPDLQKCLVEVTDKLAIAQESGEYRPLGTFKVTVTQGKTEVARALPADTERFARVVAPEAMPAILGAFETTDAFSAPDSRLKDTLAILKARTGLKEAK